MLNKKNLLNEILTKLEDDLAEAKRVAKSMRDEVIDEESRPENEYDTRALEASYLAGAQSKRVVEIEEIINIFRNIPMKDFSSTDSIATSAIIEVEHSGKKIFLFLLPKGGGKTLQFDNMSIQIVSTQSPLGETLVGLKKGDTAIVEIGDQEKEYKILNLI